jgi:hypothetical protein
MTVEGTALASVSSVIVGSTCHCVGEHERSERYSGLFYFGRRGLRHPLCWWPRQERALLWPLFTRSAWAEPGTVLAGTTLDNDPFASVRLVGMG